MSEIFRDETTTPFDGPVPASLSELRDRLDAIYRLQRHIYDVTRRYFLLGRDELIDALDLLPGETVCEIGCGTGRNLIQMAKTYPRARYFGLDASNEMLNFAIGKIDAAHIGGSIHLRHGYAQMFDPQRIFGPDPSLERGLDRVVFSYSLSMIPPWRQSIERAFDSLKPGGTLHIVDFGDQAKLPNWFRQALFGWLNLFGVHNRPELWQYVRGLEERTGAPVDIRPFARGYAFIPTVKKPS